MSPEYAMGGTFSEKSDVFSFGVLLLEIINGRRNTSPDYHEKHLNLIGYVRAHIDLELHRKYSLQSSGSCIFSKSLNACFRHGICGRKAARLSWLMKHWQPHFPHQKLRDAYILRFFVFKTMPWIGQPCQTWYSCYSVKQIAQTLNNQPLLCKARWTTIFSRKVRSRWQWSKGAKFHLCT